MQQMRIAKLCTCPHLAQVVLEDTDRTVQIALRLRPVTALLLAHEMEQTGCPGITIYHLLQELLQELGGLLWEAIIDASQEGTPVGLLVIRRGDRELRHSCHPVDAIALSLRTQVPLYATERALRIGSGEDFKTWLETVKPNDFF